MISLLAGFKCSVGSLYAYWLCTYIVLL
jgi:hypothetical protein